MMLMLMMMRKRKRRRIGGWVVVVVLMGGAGFCGFGAGYGVVGGVDLIVAVCDVRCLFD